MIVNANSIEISSQCLLQENPGEYIGAGKYSKVYKIQSQEKFYAMKKLKREVDSFNYLDNVLNEVMILKKTQHPNLLKMFGKYRTKEYYNIVLEYCNGGDLQNFMKKFGKMKENMARKVIKQLIQALNYLHTEKKIIHRDIKTQNIMLQWNFDPKNFQTLDSFAKAFGVQQKCLTTKLGDFGFARVLSPYEQMTTSFGTPLYMAPEVMAGKPYDFKADIWSLGVTFFEILTGQYPFVGLIKNEIFEKIKTGHYQIDSSLGLSPYCLDFLNQCLQFKPSKRSSAAELLSHPFLKFNLQKQKKYLRYDPNCQNLIKAWKNDKGQIKMSCHLMTIQQKSHNTNQKSESDYYPKQPIVGSFPTQKINSFELIVFKKDGQEKIQQQLDCIQEVKAILPLQKRSTTPIHFQQQVRSLPLIKSFNNLDCKPNVSNNDKLQPDQSNKKRNHLQKKLSKQSTKSDEDQCQNFKSYKLSKSPLAHLDKGQDAEILDPEIFDFFQDSTMTRTRDSNVDDTEDDSAIQEFTLQLDSKVEAHFDFQVPQLLTHGCQNLLKL